MEDEFQNIAYIDGANLDKALKELRWSLDYSRFYVWLREKYHIKRAYLFIGLIPKYKGLYTYLQESGFTLVFKEVVYDGSSKPKGNCDADMVLHAACDAYENNFNQAILVASDGDYASLVKFLLDKQKLLTILSPSIKEFCSVLLKKTEAKIVYLNDKKTQLEYRR